MGCRPSRLAISQANSSRETAFAASIQFTKPRARYIAPFSLQDVVQVVVTPCWHFRQAATH